MQTPRQVNPHRGLKSIKQTEVMKMLLFFLLLFKQTEDVNPGAVS